MSPEQWQLVSDIFNDASALAERDRPAFIARRCNGDDEVRREVESLLKFRRDEDSLFDDRPKRPTTDGEHVDFADWADRQLGPYRLKKMLSTGGMGVVFLAEQDNPRREVAIKLLHRGLFFGGAKRRFEYEAQILGRLKHPFIAEIFEAGCATLTPPPDGGPAAPLHFFAMEYVDGAQTLVEFAQSRKLSIEERLRLFNRICDGVHHGHQKGVIHRDLKPANILVTPHASASGETTVVPKIIDFGVAKCTDGDLAITTMQTNAGDLIGTLQYMSPEQCAADALEIDTRADVYALGVILYELLTGHVPYDVSNCSMPSAIRMIGESRPTPPSQFDRRLRGDLEAIITKALEKNRDARYGSAAELSIDIRRFLNGEPIDAQPPSHWRRATRWIGNHPAVSSTISSLAIAAIIIGSAFGTTWFFSDIPITLDLSSDKRKAVLRGVTGEAIHQWDSEGRIGFGFAELTKFDNDKFVILGENRDIRNDHSGQIRVFDTRRPNVPLWEDRPSNHHIPTDLLRRNRTSDTLNPVDFHVAEIFDTNPGPEIVVWYCLGDYSQRCLRIYGLANGSLLYQRWQDGGIIDVHWLAGPKLLALVAKDENTKRLGTVDGKAAPVVASCLIGLKLRLGDISNEFLFTKEKQLPESIAWLSYLEFGEYSGVFSKLEFSEPQVVFDPCCFVRLNCAMDFRSIDVGWVCTINETGKIAPNSMLPGDTYTLINQGMPRPLPSLSEFRLVDRSPI